MPSSPVRARRASYDTTDTVARSSGEASTLAGVTGTDVRAWLHAADQAARREVEQHAADERTAA